MKRRTFWFVVIMCALFLMTGCGKKKEASSETFTYEWKEVDGEEELEVTVADTSLETEVETLDEAAVKEEDINIGPVIYTVQLAALTDRSRVELEQELMHEKGVATEIETVNLEGITYYRLRLSGSFTKGRAEQLGEELKNKFSSIKDYWVVKR